jgi:hypothetical protein
MDTVLALAGFVILVIGVTYFEVKGHKKRIRECLSAKGATDIEVSWQWAWSDQSNNIYTVDYTNRQGRRCQATCKVAQFFSLSSGDIYWSEPPNV